MPRDHMLGHPAATREDFEAPCWYEHLNPYPFGVPNRVRDTWGDCEAVNQCRRPVHVTAASSTCMTRGDVVGLAAAEEPMRAAHEPISEAARWPFAGCGWRNGDGGLGEQQERVRLEKLKAAEMRERAIGIMDAAEQRKRDAITAYCNDKVRA